MKGGARSAGQAIRDQTAFGAWSAERYRESTVRNLVNAIGRYVRAVGEREALTADYADVLAYLEGLRRGGMRAKSLHGALGIAKIYYEWLLESGQRTDHPCRTLRLADPVDRQIRLEELYDPEQLAGLAPGYRAADPRDQRRGEVVIGLLVNQALTAAEVTRLRVGDVDLEAGLVDIAAGGKTAARTLSLRARQVLTLWRYLEGDRGRYVELARAGGLRADRLLFDSRGGQLIGGQLNRLINYGRAKPDHLRPQKIRQTVIAELVAAGHELRVVQAFAGHRKSSATAEYRRTGLEELAEAVAKYHPRE